MTQNNLRSTPAPVRLWRRVTPSLVPVLAVLTALVMMLPLMIVTGGEGDILRGVNIAGTAYSAMIEGSMGVAINDLVGRDDLDEFLALAAHTEIASGDLRRLERSSEQLVVIGMESAERYGGVLDAFADADEDEITAAAESLPDIEAIGVERLDALRPLIAALGELERSEVSEIAENLAALDALPEAQRADLLTRLAVIDNYTDADLLDGMRLVDQYGIVRMQRLIERVDLLRAAGIEPLAADGTIAPEAAELANITAYGISSARDANALAAQLRAADVADVVALERQIEVIRALYSANLLTDSSVNAAIETELDAALGDNLVVNRPGSGLLIDRIDQTGGVIYHNNNTPDDPSDDRPETFYLRLGGSAFLFFPTNLEGTLIRAIPFIIAGLAVALGFKAGLFNIGAEGQLYFGGIFAVWVGFSPIFADLPLFIHLPLVIVIGILGGAAWGAIPGALKAFTGAHEVIVTIMLNYVAIQLVDWLIKSTNPIILLDPTASTPRTPYLLEAARIPPLNVLPPALFIVAGVVVLALGLWARRDGLAQNPRLAIRPVIHGLVVAVGGLFLLWVGSRGLLHIGFLIMLFTVWLTEWFLNRTTLGFELRTVGANPDAARYAGMSVRRNIILAMAISGGLAGLAGAIEISGVQYNLQVGFFSGLGFDAIAVALLARTNPRNMIAAGLLWASLLSGAGLMQVRADIPIDLVKIIQALIIMFIAADTIIRYLWRVPAPTEKLASTFSKGWGS